MRVAQVEQKLHRERGNENPSLHAGHGKPDEREEAKSTAPLIPHVAIDHRQATPGDSRQRAYGMLDVVAIESLLNTLLIARQTRLGSVGGTAAESGLVEGNVRLG